MKNTRYFRLIIILIATLLVSCNDDDPSAPSVVDGLKAFPGDCRARVEFQVPAASQSGRVFSAGGKYTEFTIADNASVQSVIVEGLSEGEQTIRVVTYNSEGVSSNPKAVKVEVYGEQYKSGLAHRRLINQVTVSPTSIEMHFDEASHNEVEVRVVFSNTSGTKDSVTMKSIDRSIAINNIDLSAAYYYYTVYKPELTAIDLFATSSVDAKKAASMNFEKSKWRVIGQSSEDPTKAASQIIDNNIETIWHSASASAAPHWVAVDMQSEKLSSGFYFVQTQDVGETGFAKGFSFEISDDNQTWTTVMEGEFAANRYRQQFIFPKPVLSRYFKITVTSGFNNATYSQIAEIDLFNDENKSGENGSDIILDIPLVNAKKPFLGDGSDLFPNVGAGRFQKLVGWTHSENAYISYDNGSFTVWSSHVWGCSLVNNGKIYQTVDLEPGSYTLNINTDHATDPSGVDMYGIVAKGTTLPDYDVVTTAPEVSGYKDLVANQFKINSITFTLDAASKVTIGVVYNTHVISEEIPWSDMYINGFELLVNH